MDRRRLWIRRRLFSTGRVSFVLDHPVQPLTDREDRRSHAPPLDVHLDRVAVADVDRLLALEHREKEAHPECLVKALAWSDHHQGAVHEVLADEGLPLGVEASALGDRSRQLVQVIWLCDHHDFVLPKVVLAVGLEGATLGARLEGLFDIAVLTGGFGGFEPALVPPYPERHLGTPGAGFRGAAGCDAHGAIAGERLVGQISAALEILEVGALDRQQALVERPLRGLRRRALIQAGQKDVCERGDHGPHVVTAPMDLSGFANPWEHIRLLSDPARNAALVELLALRAPGARVLEVGCGTGLLSCIAARLGAAKVYAVEPTPMVEVARQLVADNGLGAVVEVLEGAVEEILPRPVDLAFSELLNADPFAEGVVPAMDGARSWLAPGGLLAPSRLRVYAALVRAPGSAAEARSAHREVKSLSRRFGLQLAALEQTMGTEEPYIYLTTTETPVSEPVLVCDLALGTDPVPEITEVEVLVPEAGPVGGAMVWFEAVLDEGLVLSNRPGLAGHWGQLVSAWHRERGARAGQRFSLRVTVEDDAISVVPGD